MRMTSAFAQTPQKPFTGLELEWKYGLYASGIGPSRISVFDSDGDNALEMIVITEGGAT